MPILLSDSSKTHSSQYAFVLTARGLCDYLPPSHVSVLSRLKLVEAYKEGWRTFLWSEHLALDLPPPHYAPYVSGGPCVAHLRDRGRS